MIKKEKPVSRFRQHILDSIKEREPRITLKELSSRMKIGRAKNKQKKLDSLLNSNLYFYGTSTGLRFDLQ